jgi:DNA-binding transcriptional MerR regulator/methylmalonyl-CoA mutase cobalamin-binding subunit
MDMLNTHPITVVSERTGLSQDVLRVWERRYGAVKPVRGPGGQRLYTDADIARLRLLQAATRAGRSIRLVAGLPMAELERLTSEDAAAREERVGVAPSPEAEQVVDQAFELTLQIASPELESELRRSLARFGLSVFLESVAAPLLRRIGDGWHAGRITPAQEHLAASVLYDLITETMRKFAGAAGPKIVVATLGGDRHVMGAAMVGATAAAEGWSVVYLGADLPAAEIGKAARAAAARVVAVSMVFMDERMTAARELASLREQIPGDAALWIGGQAAGQVSELADGVQRFYTLGDLRNVLQETRRELSASE